MPVQLDLHIPRHAFSVREVARAGDIWRAFQEAAVLGSSAVGWPPPRYRQEDCAFVVRSMVVRHHAEAQYGEPVRATTWVRNFRRGLLTAREIRLHGEGDRPLASATQEWVHVTFGVDADGQVTLRPSRGKPELISAFEQEEHDASPVLDQVVEAADGAPTHVRAIPLRLTEMDPLGHVNHPAYIDLVDEHTSALLHAAGIDPVALQPVSEEVRYRAGMDAPGDAVVHTTLAGVTGAGACVLAHRLLRPDGDVAAEDTTVRTLAGVEPARLRQVLLTP